MDTIGFIGVGNMGSAILKGIAGSSLKQETSLFADRRCSDRRDGSGLYRCRHRCGLYPENDKALCKSGSGDAEHTAAAGRGRNCTGER